MPTLSVPGMALLLLLNGGTPAAAVTLVEPTKDVNGQVMPTTGADALWACIYTVPDSPAPFWVKPNGQPHPLPMPTQTNQLPYRYVSQCVNRVGWGPTMTGTLDLGFTLTTP